MSGSHSDGVLCFDLGGTRLKSGIVRDGQVDRMEVSDIGRAPMEAVAAAGKRLLVTARCDAVGLCVPGLVEDGVLVSLPGKHDGLEGRHLREELQTTFGLPAFVGNDAIAYAVGESVAGAARDHQRAVVVTVGTGIGVGVVEGRRPLGSGPLGGGLMSGMIPIATGSEEADTNGQHGTIESLCAASRLLSGPAASTYSSVPDLLMAARRGESVATASLARWRDDFVRALVAIAHAHAPSLIVVGGGPVADGGLVIDGLEERVNSRLFGSYRVAIRRAELGDAAALHGIAYLAREAAA